MAADAANKKRGGAAAPQVVEGLCSLTLRGEYIAFDGEFYVPPKAASPFHHYRGPPPPWMEGGKCVTCFFPLLQCTIKDRFPGLLQKIPPCHGRLK